jgi:hypothetical protein
MGRLHPVERTDRTLLHHLMLQRNWSHADTVAKLQSGAARLGEHNFTIDRRTLYTWLGVDRDRRPRPHPVRRRVLEYVFAPWSTEDLLAPVNDDVVAHASLGAFTARARQWARLAAARDPDDTDVIALHQRLISLAERYHADPDDPDEVVAGLLILLDEVFALLHAPPARHAAGLYLQAAIGCTVLAHAATRAGYEVNARDNLATAVTCASKAGGPATLLALLDDSPPPGPALVDALTCVVDDIIRSRTSAAAAAGD